MDVKWAIRSLILFTVISLSQSKELSCDQIRKFVDGHNERRLIVAQGKLPDQPAAKNMMAMIWDEELAAKAAAWAAKHKYSHNPNKTIDSGRFGTGENMLIYMFYGNHPRPKIETVLIEWFKEHLHYTFGPLKVNDLTKESNMTRHYTQMVWADSIYLGCGISMADPGPSRLQFIVCNYGPAGNIIGQPPYKRSRSKGKLTCNSKKCKTMYGKKCK